MMRVTNSIDPSLKTSVDLDVDEAKEENRMPSLILQGKSEIRQFMTVEQLTTLRDQISYALGDIAVKPSEQKELV